MLFRAEIAISSHCGRWTESLMAPAIDRLQKHFSASAEARPIGKSIRAKTGLGVWSRTVCDTCAGGIGPCFAIPCIYLHGIPATNMIRTVVRQSCYPEFTKRSQQVGRAMPRLWKQRQNPEVQLCPHGYRTGNSHVFSDDSALRRSFGLLDHARAFQLHQEARGHLPRTHPGVRTIRAIAVPILIPPRCAQR